jgi:RNA polymerase sigma-70 factor, ECF subfamily
MPLVSKNHDSCDLASKSSSGHHASFEDLYRLYRGRVYWVCFRMVRDPAEAEDLTQEVFLHAFQKMYQFQGRAAFSTWLHRVTVNVVLMRLRKRSHSISSLEELLGSETNDHRPRNPMANIDGSLASTVDRVLLAKAIVCLPNQYRLAFTLHDFEGYPYREIALRMKCSVANAKSRVRRARLRLRELLQTSTPAQIQECSRQG